MPTYEFGDFSLDTGKRLLLDGDGKVVALTPKVYDTLAYLVQHSGAVLDKEEMMRAIWPDTTVEDNNLTQNISLLRRVFGEGRGDHRFIATVPGRGYEFVATVKQARFRNARPSPEAVWIAVLPFVNVTANPDFDYFADGLADELITALSRFAGVRVAARTSAFALKRKQIDVREIARLLQVDLVLEGSVRKSGSRIRITAELVNAGEGYQLWSERYQRETESRDLFDVQDEITAAVVNALRLELPGTRPREARQISQTNAHELYLKGRFHLLHMTEVGIQTGMQYFESAIQSDPGFAPAHVGLAHAYRMFGLTLERPATEVGARSKSAALDAIAIDNNYAEAHAVLAFTVFFYEWGWKDAEEHFRRALALNPNSADTYWMYAHVPSNFGRHDEALAMMSRARELDPVSGLIHAMEGQCLLHAGRADDSIVRLKEAIDLEPRSRVAHLFASSTYIELGRYDEAIEEARIAHELCPVNSAARSYEAYAHARAGRRAHASEHLNAIVELGNQRYVPATHMAMICNALGRRNEALAWLERAFEQRVPWLVFSAVDPKWKNLRSEARFISLLRRLSLPTAPPQES